MFKGVQHLLYINGRGVGEISFLAPLDYSQRAKAASIYAKRHKIPKNNVAISPWKMCNQRNMQEVLNEEKETEEKALRDRHLNVAVWDKEGTR